MRPKGYLGPDTPFYLQVNHSSSDRGLPKGRGKCMFKRGRLAERAIGNIGKLLADKCQLNKVETASGDDPLRTLEGLMAEFFDGGTSNERKREIEELLNNFSQQKDAWKHCLFFMANTHNEYVWMYCMTVLENLINRQWVGLQGSDKMEIRGTLNRFLTQHERLPKFVRNKLVKLVVDIGRTDWPHFYPEFFSSILQLIQQPDTIVLGLVLLHTTSEELACPREDLSIARKEELHRLLLHQVPTILNLLNNILTSILEKHRSMVTATPPPSPTHGQSATDSSKTPMSIISSSPIQPGSFISNMFRSPQSRVRTESLPPLDEHAQQTAVLALNCLTHLFSWIPLSSTITPSLLSTIFHYAVFGCEVSHSHRSGGSSQQFSNQSEESNSTLGVLAMCCINELLAKNCVPPEFEDFLLQMFQQTFYLLQRITKDSTTNATGNRLAELEESYVDKFTEFLRLFVSIHLRRFEANLQFPVLDFLSLLFKYTFKQPTHESYFTCLDIWNVFLDYLSTTMKTRTADNDGILSRYSGALSSLVTHVLEKLQFKFNQSQLDELDDDTLDDDCETEWQHFLRQSLETIAKVAELIPEETFNLIYNPFDEYLTIYLGLERFVSNGPYGRKLNVTAENDCRKMHCTMRDLSSLLQAIGRLAEHFIGEKFRERVSDCLRLVQRLVEVAVYGCRVKLYEVNSVAVGVLQGDFIELHAQAMAAVKAYSSWLAQFYVETREHQQQHEQCVSMITTLLQTIMPLFDRNVPEKVSQSAAHLLLSLLLTVRADYLLQLSLIQNFYQDVSQGSLVHLNADVQLLVYRSLSHYLLLPWPGRPDSGQDWVTRASHHHTYIRRITLSYRQLRQTTGLAEEKTLQEEAKPVVKNVLQIVSDLVKYISVDGVSKSKQLCYQSLEEVVQVTLYLFPIYIHQTDVIDDILGFFLALFQGFRIQMGVTFTEHTIQTFLSMFTREQLGKIILQESTTGYKVVDKFLRILQVVVQEPSSSFKAFIPNTISICMEQIYPIIAERPSPDIKPTLYDLLHHLLLHNWRYFFKGSVLKSLQTEQTEELDNREQFISIMQAYGQSFLQPDIAIFKQNLEALESLNMKWKLYTKKIFKEVMLFQFLNVLIQVLVHKSHDLLQEEIGITVYNMASVDFDSFYSNFLPQLLADCEGLDPSQKAILGTNFKLVKDLPSFTQSVHRFVNDLRYYRLCNSSLPEGSVKLR